MNWTERRNLATVLRTELNELSSQTGDQWTELYWTDAKQFWALNEKTL